MHVEGDGEQVLELFTRLVDRELTQAESRYSVRYLLRYRILSYPDIGLPDIVSDIDTDIGFH